MITNQLKKTSLHFFLLLVGILIFLMPFIWVNSIHPEYLQNACHIITQYKEFFIIARWLAIMGLLCMWPRLIRFWAKKHYWKPEKTIFWLNQRLKIVIWLIVFELIVCENLFLTLIHLLGRY